jgi:hypothetical protein
MQHERLYHEGGLLGKVANPWGAWMTRRISGGARMRKIMGAAVAVLVLAAAPATANAATLTVTKKTTTADTTSFGFHVEFTPFPDDNPGPFKFPPTDFTLTNGTSKTFTDLHKGFFTVTENVPAGWKLNSIECTKDPDPADAPVITGNKVRVELSPAESKSCVFTNEKLPTAAPPPPEQPSGSAPAAPAPTGSAPTAQPTPVQPPPQSAVSPERVVSARAALQAPRSCVSRRYTLTVTGGPVRSVTFSVNGRAVRTVRARPQQRRFSVVLGIRQTVDRVVARVRFRANASPRTRTLRATVRRCAQAGVSPEFTG